MPRTELPSILIPCASVPWDEPEFDFTQRAGIAQLLEMDPATYDKVCIDPFRKYGNVETYQYSWAADWQASGRWRTLHSLRAALTQMRARSGRMPRVYVGGVWGEPESEMWRDRGRRGTLFTHVRDICNWLSDESGPLCILCHDGFGEQHEPWFISNQIVAAECALGFQVEVEGYPNQQSCFWRLGSLTTSWAAGQNEGFFRTLPAARTGVLISSTAYTGVAGSAFPRNHVPRWRNCGFAVYFQINEVLNGTHLPCWNATTEDPIQPGGDGGAGGA